MKFIKTLKYSLLIGISLQLLNSCTNDFVEIDPPYQVTSESFFKSQEDFENALIGAYDLLQATYVNVIIGEIASDNTHAGGESATDVIGWQQIDRMVHTPINSNLRDVKLVVISSPKCRTRYQD